MFVFFFFSLLFLYMLFLFSFLENYISVWESAYSLGHFSGKIRDPWKHLRSTRTCLKASETETKKRKGMVVKTTKNHLNKANPHTDMKHCHQKKLFLWLCDKQNSWGPHGRCPCAALGSSWQRKTLGMFVFQRVDWCLANSVYNSMFCNTWQLCVNVWQ